MAEELRDRLRFGSQLHQFVLDACIRRKRFSEEKMMQRYNKWRQDDDAMLSYIPEKDADARRRGLRESGEPQFTTLYIPYDYAVLMAAHTYWTSVFLSRNPILQYQGQSDTAQSAELAVESLVNYQMQTGRNVPQLYVWLLDVGKYGVAILGEHWDNEKIIVNRETEVPETFMGVDLGTTKREMRRVVVPGYQGNRLYNVRPYDFYPDPRVTMANIQKGEFCGRYQPIGWNEILKGSADNRFFNVDALRSSRYASQTNLQRTESPRVLLPNQPGETSYLEAMDMGSMGCLEMYVELVPRDWGLDDSTFPEKWVFTIINEQVIVAAQPLGLFHNKFPFNIIEFEPDGYAIFKRSLLEVVKPMNDVLTWLINTHFYNTRKSLNDMWIVDPSKIVMKDLLDPKPGKIIRLKEELYGQDVRTAAYQFPVQNVTQGHMADAQIVQQMIQRVSGVSDNIMGMLNPGGRRTATESRISSTFGVNRLKTTAEYFSCTGFSDLGMLTLQQTQQLYDTARKVRIAGDAWSNPGAEQHLVVSPSDIQGFFDFVPVDGTLPIDRFALINMWTQLLGQMAQAPQVMAQYDLGKIFGWMAQMGGLKNVQRFRIQATDPVALQQQAQAGNVVPMGGRGGKRRPSGGSGGPGGVALPPQIAGMGPAG